MPKRIVVSPTRRNCQNRSISYFESFFSFSEMVGIRENCRLAAVVVFSAWIGLVALYGLLKPATSGCIMTYMYPTYIPISMQDNTFLDKYSLFLYHEGWKKIDFGEHLKQLNGFPVLFIPGNGGSYKQVRSLAAESSRAFQGGPLEPTFYKETSFSGGMTDELEDEGVFSMPTRYNKMLDWFAVDLEGEHSAMDGRILEEHTEYVVYAIHKILDQYKDSQHARLKEGGDVSGSLPTSVILVGHSMGGFVARAAVIHPHLRNSAVETILTLSSPHQSPPLAVQPSLGHFFSHVNKQWVKGYELQKNHTGRLVSTPKLSHVVVVSISGGIHDYQVRTKLSSLDGIIPPSHGFMISSSGIKNAWATMDHQSILWCNQLVVQLSHTLLSVANHGSSQSFSSTRKRLAVFTSMLESGIPQSFNWNKGSYPAHRSLPTTVTILKGDSSCPTHVQWGDDSLEKDLYIQSATVTVLAMDGRRRWMDIAKVGSNGSAHFAFVTNLIPCSGVRLHLWSERGNPHGTSTKKTVEVTSKMIHIPSGPVPRQIEPGSQTEQAPPSALLWLTPEDMHGFRFLTISVAPRPTVSGRPPPAASMAVGQFFHPEGGKREFSAWALLHPGNAIKGIFLKEDHPLALNLSYSVSLGFLPVTMSVQTVGCGIKNSALPVEQAGDTEQRSLCRLRCFPPVALTWDSTSGLQVIPNLYSETLVVDSSPAFWDLNQGSDKTTVLLLVDPHCSYEITSPVSFSAVASRLFLSYSSQIAGFLVAVIFFAIMQQARCWELDLAVPSILTAVELNLRAPFFFSLAVAPITVSLVMSFLRAPEHPSVGCLFAVSLVCYLIANGYAMLLIMCSKFVLYLTASSHVFIKIRWQSWQGNICIVLVQKIFSFSSIFHSFKVIRFLKGHPDLVVSLVAVPLVCFVHPAIGLLILLLFHAYCCHAALCSFLTASFHSLAQKSEYNDSTTDNDQLIFPNSQRNGTFIQLVPPSKNPYENPSPGRSFGDSQIESFNCRHGMLILHLVAVLMFFPSLIAWLQRIGTSQRFPWFIDSMLCVGVISHGLTGWKPDISFFRFRLPFIHERECCLSLVYLLCGYYSFISALATAPYRSFYPMAFLGALSFASRFSDRRNRERDDGYFNNYRKHSHKH